MAAKDSRLGRLVAVKRILPGLDDYEGLVKRFRTEAKALAALKHPNIVDIYSLGLDEYGDFIEMEYIDGPNLYDLIKQRTIFSADEAIRLVRKVCVALQKAHSQSIIHRDIKPSNVLLTRDGQPKLTDFGLAQMTSDDHSRLVTQSGRALGTEGYIAPEQAADAKRASAASDQYSLAATMYQMVTGRSPRAIIFKHVPEALRDVLERALEERPEDRFPSIAEFHNALGVVLKQGDSIPQPAKQSAAGPKEKSLAEVLQELTKRVEESHDEARECYAQYDDAGVMRCLGHIPEHLRDKKLEEQAKTRLERTTKLEKEIRQRVHALQTKELRPLVEEYLSLYPERQEMQALLKQLPAKPDSQPTANAIKQPVLQLNRIPKAAKASKLPALLMAPFDAKTARQGQEEWAKFLDRPVEWTNDIGMKFRLIPPGEFLMGAANDEDGASNNEKPQHIVRITKPFYLGIYPVTQEEYKKVTGSNPSSFKGDQLPVERVSWNDAQEFLKKLTSKDGSQSYRLPTEAEWEYSCRAGTTTPFWFGSELNGEQANCDGRYPYGTSTSGPYLKRTTTVGHYAANPLGIFDQHGNVLEWCQDWYSADYRRALLTDLPESAEKHWSLEPPDRPLKHRSRPRIQCCLDAAVLLGTKLKQVWLTLQTIWILVHSQGHKEHSIQSMTCGCSQQGLAATGGTVEQYVSVRSKRNPFWRSSQIECIGALNSANCIVQSSNLIPTYVGLVLEGLYC